MIGWKSRVTESCHFGHNPCTNSVQTPREPSCEEYLRYWETFVRLLPTSIQILSTLGDSGVRKEDESSREEPGDRCGFGRDMKLKYRLDGTRPPPGDRFLRECPRERLYLWEHLICSHAFFLGEFNMPSTDNKGLRASWLSSTNIPLRALPCHSLPSNPAELIA